METPIIDIHTHIFPDSLAERAIGKLTEHSGEYKPFINGTSAQLKQSMNKAGIKYSCIANIATKPEQFTPVMKWIKSNKDDSIIHLGTFHPSSDNYKKEIDDIKDAGLKGIKLHAMYQNFTIDEDAMFPIYKYIADSGLFILFHAGYDIAFPGDRRATPDKIVNVKHKVPDLKMIAAHLGAWRDWENCLNVLCGEDIYIDTSFIHEVEPEILHKMLSKHSKERFVFGSDSPWLDQKQQVDFIKKLNLGNDFNDKLFYKNAADLLEIPV